MGAMHGLLYIYISLPLDCLIVVDVYFTRRALFLASLPLPLALLLFTALHCLALLFTVLHYLALLLFTASHCLALL